MYTRKLLPEKAPLALALGVLVAFTIGIVPACSSSAKPPQENNDVNPMDTSQDAMQPLPQPSPTPSPAPEPTPMFEDPPPIDAAAPKDVQTATFATG